MRLRGLFVAVVGSVVVVAPPAFGKGVSGATIDGPGLDGPVAVAEEDLGELVEATGFWVLMYGSDGWETPTVRRLDEAPDGPLGRGYAITWYLGDEPYPATSTLFPSAAFGPVVHVEAGVPGGRFGIETVPGGWVTADPAALDLLAKYGGSLRDVLPASEPTPRAPPSVAPTLPGVEDVADPRPELRRRAAGIVPGGDPAPAAPWGAVGVVAAVSVLGGLTLVRLRRGGV